jgi:hypothetical protein
MVAIAVRSRTCGEVSNQGLQGGGWAWILSNMKTLLETSEPMPEEY